MTEEQEKRVVPPTKKDLNHVWVDSRARWLVGRYWEGRVLKRLGARGRRCLEIGTGRRGLGARCAVELFGAEEVTAIDLHSESVKSARRHLGDLPQVKVRIADATGTGLGPMSIDLVVSFHALHHITKWRAAVKEAARILEPGGQLVLTEMTSKIIDAPWFRRFSYHPPDRFDAQELLEELERNGFELDPRRTRVRFGMRLVQAVAVRK